MFCHPETVFLISHLSRLSFRTLPLDRKEREGDPCDALARHLPAQAHTIIFGQPSAEATKTNAALTAAQRKVPPLSVYIVSTNLEHESAVCFLFQEIPSNIYKFEAQQFFTKEEGAYEGIGVDRVAALYACKQQFSGRPVLAFDAGTAWTYTALNASGVILGGGIAPGVGARFRAMGDFCGNLPVIDHKIYHAVLKEKLKNEKSFPIFAKDTKTAMMTTVFSEIANQCRYIVKHFLEQCQDCPPKSLPVIAVAGGDAPFLQKVLQDDFSGVVAKEPGSDMPVNRFEVHEMKHLVHYGIGKFLANQKETTLSADDQMRESLKGIRVAKEFPVPDYDGDSTYRGSVISIKVGASLIDDLFMIRYDDGDEEQLELNELYEAMKLYQDIGEKESTENKSLTSEKQASTDKLINALGTVDPELEDEAKKRADRKELERKKKQEIDERKKEATKRRLTSDESSSKKARKGNIISKKTMYTNMRIAKEFEEEENGEIFRNIYYGTIDKVENEDDHESNWLWHVAYDDDDEEELDEEEIKDCLKFYEKHRDGDPRLAEIAEASNEAGLSADTVVVMTKHR